MKTIVSIVTWARTLLMRVVFLMMWYGIVGRGMINGEWDQAKRREALESEEFSWLDLPTDMVELIMMKLPYADFPKLACVCKSWRDIMQTSLPNVYPVGKTPLLLHVKSRGGGEEGAIFHYYSPWLNKTFQVGFPLELKGYEIISAKDGALLIYNQDEMKMMMVDPFNGHSITCAGITSNLSFNGTAIGVHDGHYTIFLIDTSDEDQVTVHVHDKLGWAVDLVWDNGDMPFCMAPSSNPVYCDGRFYCLGKKADCIGVFDLVEWTWRIHNVEFVNQYDDDDDDDTYHCYLVEWINTVMAVRKKNAAGSEIHMFCLDRKKMVWEEVDDLGDRSLFLSSALPAVCLRTDKKLRNRVFLPHSCHRDQPKTAIVAEVEVSDDVFYFVSMSFISTEENNHTATASLCWCSNRAAESECFGWFEPFYFDSSVLNVVSACMSRRCCCYKYIYDTCLFYYCIYKFE